MPVILSHLGTVSRFNYRYLIRSRNSFKYYPNDVDIAFGVISFSCSILTTTSILFLSLSFGVFLCNTIKIFLFSRFRKIKGVSVCIYVFALFVSLFS